MEAGKIAVLIVDEIVNVTYYFVCGEQEKKRFLPLIKRLEQDFEIIKSSGGSCQQQIL